MASGLKSCIRHTIAGNVLEEIRCIIIFDFYPPLAVSVSSPSLHGFRSRQLHLWHIQLDSATYGQSQQQLMVVSHAITYWLPYSKAVSVNGRIICYWKGSKSTDLYTSYIRLSACSISPIGVNSCRLSGSRPPITETPGLPSHWAPPIFRQDFVGVRVKMALWEWYYTRV